LGRIYVTIREDLQKRFKYIVIAKYGKLRGYLTKSVEEAIKQWIEREEAQLKKVRKLRSEGTKSR